MWPDSSGLLLLGPILVSAHNLTYYQRLMADAREAIRAGQFADFHRQKLIDWQTVAEQSDAG